MDGRLCALQGCFHFSYDRVERRGIAHGDFREALTVELDVGGLQSGDELAVAKVSLAAGGAEAKDPEAAKISLADAAIAKGECAGAGERLLNRAE